MKNILLLISIWFGAFINVQGQSFNSDEFEAKIDSLIPTAINDTTPGLVLGVVHNGELIFSKGYGLANLSYSMPNDPKMVYNLGSVSKQFLGYAFAMLHVEGSLDLDDPVSKYLEDWPEFEHTVTLRHLLTHTSGYREAYTMSNLAGRYIGTDRLSREECLNVVRRQPQLEFVPGSRYTYNSTAWVILAEVFEKVKGKSAEDWVKSNILDPLGMKNTQIETYVGEVMVNSAESYSVNDDQEYTNDKSNRAIFGAAEVYSSVQDLVKWINNYRTSEIGGKAVKEIFLDPYILNDGSNSEYALGIGNSSYRGLKRYKHTGGHEAFLTQLSYFPDQDLGIITISNFGGRGWLANTKIAELFLEEQMTSGANSEIKEFKVKKKNLEQFTGRYLLSSLNRTLDLTILDDKLTLNGNEVLIPVNKNTFRIEGQEDEFRIEILDDGTTQLTSASNNIYHRIDPWNPGLEELSKFESDYWSDELETLYHLELRDEKLTIQNRWIGEVTLEPITRDFFRMEWGYYVKFNRNPEENISGLSIFSGRTLNVKFQRKE